MDQHLWESIHRLALIAEKIEYQRMDHNTGTLPESDEEKQVVKTWNDFQQMLTARFHENWSFEPRKANSFAHYLGIIRAFADIQMGTVTLRDRSTISFQVKVHASKAAKMTLTGLTQSQGCPITLDQFKLDEGTCEEIFNRLNMFSLMFIRPRR